MSEYFETLPKPIIELIMNYLNIKERARFGRTCQKYKIHAPGLNGLIKNYRKMVRIVNIVHNTESECICRICTLGGGRSNDCFICKKDTCYDCINRETGQCEFCEYQTICSECDKNAFATCFGCKQIKCSDHVKYFKVGILQCSKCERE